MFYIFPRFSFNFVALYCKLLDNFTSSNLKNIFTQRGGKCLVGWTCWSNFMHTDITLFFLGVTKQKVRKLHYMNSGWCFAVTHYFLNKWLPRETGLFSVQFIIFYTSKGRGNSSMIWLNWYLFKCVSVLVLFVFILVSFHCVSILCTSCTHGRIKTM